MILCEGKKNSHFSKKQNYRQFCHEACEIIRKQNNTVDRCGWQQIINSAMNITFLVPPFSASILNRDNVGDSLLIFTALPYMWKKKMVFHFGKI